MSRYEFVTNTPYLNYVVTTNEAIVGSYPNLVYRISGYFQYYCPRGSASMYYNGVISYFHTAVVSSNVSFSLGAGQYSGAFGHFTVDLPWGSARSVSHIVGTSVSAYYSGSGNAGLPSLTIGAGTLSASLKSVGEQSCVIAIAYTSPYNYWYTRVYNVTDNKWSLSPASNGNNTITSLTPGKKYSFNVELWGRDSNKIITREVVCETEMPVGILEAFIKGYDHNSCVVNVSLTNNSYGHWYCKIFDEVSNKYVVNPTINGDNVIKNLKAGTNYRLRVEMWSKDEVKEKQEILSFKTIGITFVDKIESDYINDPITIHLTSYSDTFTNNLVFKIQNEVFYTISNFTTSGLKYDVFLNWSEEQIQFIYELIKNSPSANCTVDIETFENNISLGVSTYRFQIYKKPPTDFIYAKLTDGTNDILPLMFMPKGIIVEMATNPMKFYGGQWKKISVDTWQQIEYEPNPYSRNRLSYNLGKRREIKG